MNIDEGIKMLSGLKQNKEKVEDYKETNNHAKGMMGLKNVLTKTMAELTKIIIGNRFEVSVKNFPKSTTVNNKELNVKVSNFPKKEAVEKVEVVNQPQINFSTTKLEDRIEFLRSGLEKILPTLKTSSTGQMVRLLNLQDSLDEAVKAIKNIKLDPKITVKPTDVKVDAPIVNVKETKIPPFPKKITADVDMSALEDKIDELITETQYQTSKPIIVANTGDFPVATTNTRDLAKEAKQLPDNHNVTVSNQPTDIEVNNFPTEYPLPSAQLTTLTPPAAITGFATSAKQDDIIAKLPLNEVGRLKTSNLPADITPVTGTITANAQTIPVPTDRVSNVMAHCYGTFSTVNCTFEGSLNSTNGTDGNWFTIQAVRTNTNTVETATGNLSAAPAYGWELSVNALRYMRVRATAFTSGTQNWVFTLGSYATEPIPAVQTHAVTVGSASTSIGKAEDGASASGNVGVPPMVVRADTLQASAGVSANGDYAFMFCDVDGRLYTNSMMVAKTGDSTYQVPRIDAATHTLQTIDYEHHEVHAGSHFVYYDYDGDVDTNAPKYYRLTTPNTTKWIHIIFSLYSEGSGTWQLFENPTVNAAGTTATAVNNDRNSLTAATLAIAYDATSTADGTQIKVWRTGSETNAPSRAGSEARSAVELILKQNEDYFLKFTPDADNAKTKVEFLFYEHTNKTA